MEKIEMFKTNIEIWNYLCNCNYVEMYNINSYLGEIQQHLIDIVLTLFHENL